MHWKDARESLLQRFVASKRPGLITDMDGTISPIVPTPSDAYPTERSRAALAALHPQMALVAVLSGRAVADLVERVGLPELAYGGNHGLERWQDGAVVLAEAARPYRPALEAAMAQIEPLLQAGEWIEDKGATLSLHYRNSHDAQAAVRLAPLLETQAQAQGLALFSGRMIYELRPPLPIDKGSAFRDMVREYRLGAALYLGDDVTDADALRAARQLRQAGEVYALGVGVGEDLPDAVRESADLFVPEGVSGVEALLEWLVSARMASST